MNAKAFATAPSVRGKRRTIVRDSVERFILQGDWNQACRRLDSILVIEPLPPVRPLTEATASTSQVGLL